jgi:hypothetical protein
MKRRSGNRFLQLVIGFVLCFSASYSQIVSTFNKIAVADSLKDYSFIVSGHFHGASSNVSTFPASTILANIDTLNALKPAFLMCLGDLFIDVNEKYAAHYQRSLFNKLQIPLLNAVGNHDVANGNIYEKFYGKEYFSFRINSELFIVLNTEENDGSIKGKQLDFFKTTLASASDIHNIFIFSHRPIWAEHIDKYKGLFQGNTRSSFGENNFSTHILPELKSIAADKNVFWLSGSMAGGPASFFYDKDQETKITFIQTAIRDLPRDAVLQVNLKNAEVSFKGISLTGEELKSIEEYNVSFWTKTTPQEEKFNFRLLPLMIFKMLTHRYFWMGVVISLISCFLISWLIKKWKRKK